MARDMAAERESARKRQQLPLLALGTLFAMLCLPLIISTGTPNFADDERNYHVPAIRQIAANWPALDLARDSLSATGPGYHYVLATISKPFGLGIGGLRFANWTVSLAVLILLHRYCAKYVGDLDAALLLAPLAASNFFIKSASWVVTDNAGLLLATLALLVALTPPRGGGGIVTLGLVSAASVMVRQQNAWLAALPAALAAFEGADRKIRRWLALAATLPLAVLAYLYAEWGGLVPPAWQQQAQQFSAAGVVYLSSVFGLLATFYLLAILPSLRRFAPIKGLVGVAALGCGLALCTATTPDKEAGRWGGYLWNLAEHLPALGSANLLFVFLCGLGTATAYVFARALLDAEHRREAVLFVVSLSAWASTFLLNRQAFHRYFEPTSLILLIVFGSMVLNRTGNPGVRRGALLALTVIQLLITLYTTHRVVWQLTTSS